MNKWIKIGTIGVVLLGILLSSCGNSDKERSRILKVYNWGDYIDEEVLAEFPAWYREQTGEDIRIIYQVFDINEIMLTKIERGHEDFDLVCPSEYIIERMLKKDLLLPIDTHFGRTPDYLRNVSPYIHEQLNKLSQPGRTTTDYAVPYMWGTAGILYNRKRVTDEEVRSWESLWNPKNRNKILMKDSYRDAYGTAIIYAHAGQLAAGTVTVEQLMNDNSPEAIALAEEYLKRLKPNIAGWEADFGKEMMTKGKTALNLTWSGDAVWAIEEAAQVGVDLGYVVPREGSNIWYDGWVIPRYARNVKAASYFINYLCRPDIALRNMDAIGAHGGDRKDTASRTFDYALWDHVLSDLNDQYSVFKSITLTEKNAQIVPDPNAYLRRSDTAEFDPRTGKIRQIAYYRDTPRSQSLRGWFYAFHTGTWGGLTTKILYFLGALIGGILPLTGYYLWWKRARSRQKGSVTLHRQGSARGE